MDFDFTDEQKQIQREANRFLADRNAVVSARSVLENHHSHDRKLWQQIAELGWTAISIPENYGGLGLSSLEVCVVAEEIGRFLAPIPYASSVYIATSALLKFGNEDQKSHWLPELATGEIIGTFAANEPQQKGTLQSLSTIFDNGRVSGIKHPVSDGNIADIAIVVALEKDVPGLFIVDLREQSIGKKTLQTIGLRQDTATLTFNNTPGERLEFATGWDAVQHVLDHAAILLAFEQLGGADACLEMARDYALERQVFGRKLGSYQALKHKLADIYTNNQLARSNCYYGAWAASEKNSPLARAACLSRLSTIKAYEFAAKENIQTHGAMGFTWETDCHLFLRHSKQTSLMLGNERTWRERLMSLKIQTNVGKTATESPPIF